MFYGSLGQQGKGHWTVPTSTGGCGGYAGPGTCGSQGVGSWLSLLGTADRRSPCSCLHLSLLPNGTLPQGHSP